MAQEVFIQAFRKLGQLDDPRCFAGWLRAIAVRMAINRAVRRPPVTSVEPEIIAADCIEEETPLGIALTAERRSQVHEGLQRLGKMDRDTLLAFYFDGRSLVEMSNSFQSPVGTIKRRLHVARKRTGKGAERFGTGMLGKTEQKRVSRNRLRCAGIAHKRIASGCG